MNTEKSLYPTYAQERIHYLQSHIVPLEISLAGFPEAEKEAPIDLYGYVTAVYKDMYENPGEYGIDCAGMEEEIGSRGGYREAYVSAKWNGYADKLQKLEEINRLDLFFSLLCRLSGGKLRFDGEHYFEAAKEWKTYVRSLDRRMKYKDAGLSTEKILARTGWHITYDNDRAIFKNDRYPRMFEALYSWASLFQENDSQKPICKYAFRTLDFRIFKPGYAPALEDFLQYLSGEERAFFEEIAEFLDQLGLGLKKDRISTYDDFKCKYKNSLLVCFSNRLRPVLKLGMFESSMSGSGKHSKRYAEFERRIEALPNAVRVKQLIYKNHTACICCGCCCKMFGTTHPSQLGRPAVIFGRKVRQCGGKYQLWISSFTKENLEIAKDIIKINYEIAGISESEL